jgi:hypothetical protein
MVVLSIHIQEPHMFKNLSKAEKLPEHPPFFAELMDSNDDLDPADRIPFVGAYVEILPRGLIVDEI